MWLFLHIVFLIGFRNRIYVMMAWFWAYLSRERSARLITGDADDLKDALQFLNGPAKHLPAVSAKKAVVKKNS